MMSNKLARLFVFAYSVLLHVLVFLVLMRYRSPLFAHQISKKIFEFKFPGSPTLTLTAATLRQSGTRSTCSTWRTRTGTSKTRRRRWLTGIRRKDNDLFRNRNRERNALVLLLHMGIFCKSVQAHGFKYIFGSYFSLLLLLLIILLCLLFCSRKFTGFSRSPTCHINIRTYEN